MRASRVSACTAAAFAQLIMRARMRDLAAHGAAFVVCCGASNFEIVLAQSESDNDSSTLYRSHEHEHSAYMLRKPHVDVCAALRVFSLLQ